MANGDGTATCAHRWRRARHTGRSSAPREPGDTHRDGQRCDRSQRGDSGARRQSPWRPTGRPGASRPTPAGRRRRRLPSDPWRHRTGPAPHRSPARSVRHGPARRVPGRPPATAHGVRPDWRPHSRAPDATDQSRQPRSRRRSSRSPGGARKESSRMSGRATDGESPVDPPSRLGSLVGPIDVSSRTTSRCRPDSGSCRRTRTADRRHRDTRSRSGRAFRCGVHATPSRSERRHSPPNRAPGGRIR